MSKCFNCKYLTMDGFCSLTGLASGENCPIDRKIKTCVNCRFMRADGIDNCWCLHHRTRIGDFYIETCKFWSSRDNDVKEYDGNSQGKTQNWMVGDKVKAGNIIAIVREIHYNPERYYLETCRGNKKITFFPHKGNRSGWVDSYE